MIRAVIWKGSTLLAVPDSWKILELLRQKRIFSIPFFASQEAIPADILGMQGSWHVAAYIWNSAAEEPDGRSLAVFTRFLLNERSFDADNGVAYVGDAMEDVALARKDQIKPILVRTGDIGLGLVSLANVSVLPSAQFVPRWIDRENKKAAAANLWDGGPRLA